MKYVMFAHGGSNNHGCEAIVRSTVNMLGNENRYFLQSFAPEEDRKFGLDKYAKIITSKQSNIEVDSLTGYYLRAKSHINRRFGFDIRQSIYRNKSLLKSGAVALSIGGDNYCYNSIIHSMRDKLTAFSTKGIPVVLWGCSVDPEKFTKPVIGDLEKYSLITARESITAELLGESGFGDKTVLCSDPAFTLPKQQIDWNNSIFEKNPVLGINVSDFMGYYNAYPNATYNNFKSLINHLFKNTDYHIALIPHVRQPGNDDLIPCRQLADEFNSERITVVSEDYNCMQLKYIISKCEMFIGCRTHSTIAAYSTNVPTLVVGYSIKAKGIAKDIFGDYTDLLVDVRNFESDNDLLNKFLAFSEKKEELKAHLQKVMPEYINRAYLAKDALEKMFKI